MQKHNFDHWANLAENDPEAFERSREEMLLAFIRQSEFSNHLSWIQLQIEAFRNSGKPLQETIEHLSREMWSSAEHMNALFAHHAGDVLQSLHIQNPPEHACKIIDLHAFRRDRQHSA
jgi:hypothetical protein